MGRGRESHPFQAQPWKPKGNRERALPQPVDQKDIGAGQRVPSAVLQEALRQCAQDELVSGAGPVLRVGLKRAAPLSVMDAVAEAWRRRGRLDASLRPRLPVFCT